jgi:hypothetical protein
MMIRLLKSLILQPAAAASFGSAKNMIPFIEIMNPSRYLRLLTAKAGQLRIQTRMSETAIFARCAAALVVVVHACALARGGC